ncbi:MAG: penicillin-binding protein 2 [Bacillota bacterium]|nr:penicillin-binding protein 2 [Bacillota bacterium]
MKQAELEKKLKIYAYITTVLLLILCVKLAVVQIFYNDQYQMQASDNRLRLVSIKAPRGEIMDCNGEKLAANKLVYTVRLTYLGVKNQDQIIEQLSELLMHNYSEVTPDFIKEKIEIQKYRLFEPIVLVRDIPWELVVELEENRHELPGVDIAIEPLRAYPNGTLTGHVLGYIHSINSEEIEQSDEEYNLNSLIGKAGIEKQYEKELRGKEGARRVEVDAAGRPVGELVTLQPQPGNNLILTIDKKLQTVMENSLEENLIRLQKKHPKAKVGSSILMDVKTGEVLALTSMPALNPDDWKGNISNERVGYYFPQGLYDSLNPGAALNRAIQVTYPPGSTFKPITGMAALDSEVMDPLEDFVNCAGAYWIAPYIACTAAHGEVNYYSAMAKSCNTYFQEMGRRAGKDEMIRVAGEFGLGEKTGIDIPYETSGLIPTPEWKKEINALLIDRKYDRLRKELEDRYERLIANAVSEDEVISMEKQKKNESARLEAQYKIDYNFDTKWQQFDTFNMAIGQGSNNYTVIGLANFVSTIANGGDLMKPHILKEVRSSENELVERIKPKRIHHTNVSTRTLAETRRAMLQVTQPGGTAHFLFYDFPPEITVAAKTGTAQTGRSGDAVMGEFHGVFIAFAPADDPQIAFAGVVEYGQHGSESAGWVAKALFEQYFGIKDHYTEIIAQQEETVDPEQMQQLLSVVPMMEQPLP